MINYVFVDPGLSKCVIALGSNVSVTFAWIDRNLKVLDLVKTDESLYESLYPKCVLEQRFNYIRLWLEQLPLQSGELS